MRIILSLLILLTSICSYGQAGLLYPDYFSGYLYTLPLVNPSYVPASGNVEISAAYKFRSGVLKDVATLAAYAGKSWRNDTRVHSGRLIFFNEREGSYISRPKAYLNYAYKLPLSSITEIMGGAALGFSSVNFSAPSGSGTTTLPDGSIGIGIRVSSFEAGASYMHVIQSVAELNGAILQLPKIYNFHLSGQTALNPYLDIKGFGLYKIMELLPHQYNIGASFIYNESVELGGLYKNNRGISILSSFNLNRENNPLFITVTYNSSVLSNTPVWGQSFELGLKYEVR